MKFKVKLFRNPNDFKFGTWRYEHKTGGGTIIYGRLKKNNTECKYQEIYRVD